MNIIETLLWGVLFFWIGWMSTTGVKSQWVRVLDVLVYGPLLIYTSIYAVQNEALSLALLFMGVTTIAYNGKNYWIQQTDRGKIEEEM